MSAGVQRREIARRVFAAEFRLADESIRVGAGERAPTYVISPGGAWMNRVFAVGVLTEQTDVSAGEMIRARIADPTGAVVTYAGQYQPTAAARLDQATVGSMLALTGKARTYQPDDGDAVYTSIRPEAVTVVDAPTQEQWIVDTAVATLRRVDLVAALMAAAPPTVELAALASADGIDDQVLGAVAALQRYHPGLGFLEQLRVLAVEALEVVTGDRDAVSDVSLAIGADAPGLGEVPSAARSPVDVEAVLATIDAVAAGPQATGGVAAPDPDAPDPQPPDAGATGDAEVAAMDPPAASAGEEEAMPGEEPVPSASADGPPAETEAVEAAPPDPPAAAESTAGDTPDPSPETDPSGAEPASAGASDPSTPSEPAGPAATDDSPDPSTIEAEVEQLGTFELGEETRAELEEEFDTDFTTGAELEADTPEEQAAASAGEEPEEQAAASAEEPEEQASTSAGEPEEQASASAGEEPVELVVAAMNALDDGDGAPTTAVVEQVVNEADLDHAAVEAAIEEALMGGRCYEPAEGRLTAI